MEHKVMQLLQIQNQNISAKVDSNFAHLANYVWHLDSDGHVVRHESLGALKRTIRLIDHIVLPSAGIAVSHKSEDLTDCQTSNLRISFDLVTETELPVVEPEDVKVTECGRLKGVFKIGERFQASACKNAKQMYLGTFDTAELAARVRDAFIVKNSLGGDLNFPNDVDLELAKIAYPERITSAVKSRFKGVHWHTKQQRWHSWIMNNGKKEHLGSFATKIEAAKAYNKRARQCGLKLNKIPRS